MQRRSFIKGIIGFAVAPMFLPGAGRLWKATAVVEPVVPALSSPFLLQAAAYMNVEEFLLHANNGQYYDPNDARLTEYLATLDRVSFQPGRLVKTIQTT